MLRVDGLTATLGESRLVDDVSFRVVPGRLHALVGESGSGKTMTALALLRLTPEGVSVSGQVTPLERGPGITMVLQEPLSALNPVLRVQSHLMEGLRERSGEVAKARCLALLHEVGLGEAQRVAYPHQLSGGMRQRVLLAAALAPEPRVLIADEPTTALDASLRSSVMALLTSLAQNRQLAVLLLTHDLTVVREFCDDVSVMYAGRIVEQGAVKTVMRAPRHPYTEALLRVSPKGADRSKPLPTLQGRVPLPAEVIEGCRFRPRCAFADSACLKRPLLLEGVACHHPLA